MSRFPQFIVYCTCRGTWSFKQIWIPFIQGCFVQSLIGPVLIHDPDRLLTFDLMVKFIGFLTCFHVWSIIFFWFDIGLPYVWHMGVSPWEDVSQTFNIDLWPQGQIYRFLLCLCVQPSWNFCLLWHWHTLFAHGSITTRGCVAYIHDPDMMLTFDLNVKFIGFMTNLIEIRSFHPLNHLLYKYLMKPLFSHVNL